MVEDEKELVDTVFQFALDELSGGYDSSLSFLKKKKDGTVSNKIDFLKVYYCTLPSFKNISYREAERITKYSQQLLDNPMQGIEFAMERLREFYEEELTEEDRKYMIKKGILDKDLEKELEQRRKEMQRKFDLKQKKQI